MRLALFVLFLVIGVLATLAVSSGAGWAQQLDKQQSWNLAKDSKSSLSIGGTTPTPWNAIQYGGSLAADPLLQIMRSGEILVRGKPATDAEIVEALREWARRTVR